MSIESEMNNDDILLCEMVDIVSEPEILGLCRSFITGSLAYGVPHETSDCDLVVLVSVQDLIKLKSFQNSTMTELRENSALVAVNEEDSYEMDNCTTACLRFGSLNLIVLTQESDFLAWKEGTEELIARKPVSRDVAVAHLSAKRYAAKQNGK